MRPKYIYGRASLFGKVIARGSLNASNDETREKIMPINRKWPIQDLMKSVSNYSKQKNQIVDNFEI